MTDGVAVFDDVFTFLNIFNEHLVTGGRVLIQDDALAIDGNDFSFFLSLQADHYAVCRINF